MIGLRMIRWELRRRRMANRMRRQGALPHEITVALYEDAQRHPHPITEPPGVTTAGQ